MMGLAKILDFPFNVINNFKLFPFKIAIKFPIYFSRNVGIVKAKRGSIVFNSRITKYMVRYGSYGSPFINSNKAFLQIDNDGKIIFNGSATFAQGNRLYISGGTLEVGNNVYINKNLILQCERNIQLGDNTLLGWNISIRDTDGHKVTINENGSNDTKQIVIEKNSWIASDVTILKGSVVPQGSIVACNSVVVGTKFDEENILIAGYPAKEKRRNVKRIS
jgi:acetyltransferase-like isoleucine patch superfamily enzyme